MTLPHREAIGIARAVFDALLEGCEVLDITGQLRRGEPVIDRIELVAMPKVTERVFGEDIDGLSEAIDEHVRRGLLHWPEGGRVVPEDMLEDVEYVLQTKDGFPVTVWAVRAPAQYGTVLAITTGPDAMVKRLDEGARSRGYRLEAGRLIDEATNATLTTPHERGFFNACAVPFLNPGQRR